MVDLKEDDESIDSALSQQVNAENSSKEDKLETSSDSEKPVKQQEPVSTPEKKPNSLKIIIIIAIIAIAVILLLVLVLTAFTLLKGKSRALETDSNIKEAKVDKETAYITLTNDVNLSALESIDIIFSDAKNNKYAYSTSIPTKEYEIKAAFLNISSFENITSVSALLTFKSAPAPPINNTNTTNVSCSNSCSSLGKKCGNWNICNQSVNCGNCTTGACNSTGQCSVSCFDECASEGLFCQGNMRYNCSVGTDRCLRRVNLTQCSSGEQCVNGTCSVLAECTSNSTCTAEFTKVCSVGFCNSTGKCQAIYNSSAQVCRNNVSECNFASNCTGSSSACPDNINKTDGTTCSLGFCRQGKCVRCLSDSNCSADKCYESEYRDYFCNSTNSCQYNIITKPENLTNNNCADGIDNDCNNIYDGAEENCTCGNNIIEGTEVCDGTSLNGKTCTDFEGYGGGTLACLADCSNYDTSGCQGTAPTMSPFVKLWEWLKELF